MVSNVKHDYCYAQQSVEKSLAQERIKNRILEDKYEASQKCIKALREKLKRRDQENKDLLFPAREQRLLETDQCELLKANLSAEAQELFLNEQKQSCTTPAGRRYSDELKAFAVTLHFYSPQAYEFIRKHLTLPGPSTIRLWASSLNCEPGFLLDSLDGMAAKLREDEKRQDVCIMFDAMALKKECCYDPKSGKYTGFVNFGTETSSPDHLATEALVVMAVGLRVHWKQPIAYFLIDKLSAEVQSSLVRDAITEMTERGFTVHATVCDGNYTNQKTASLLGCTLSAAGLCSAFSHPVMPSEKVFFIFDACHLLKNFRNLFADCKIIFDSAGEKIEWRFVEALHALQLTDNLYLANKLTSRHIDFINNKMNVKLAAQTLSSSVADAIDFCRDDLKLRQFADSQATVKFIRTIDKLFDYCNSSSCVAKGFKTPIFNRNLPHRLSDMQNIADYISKLTDNSPLKTPLVQGRRKTAVLGFLITIQSIRGLAQRLLQDLDCPFRFVLTYKFSQDHLETFFSRIRRRGGWNNNPNTQQFKYALRSCMLKNGIKPSAKANCQEQAEGLTIEPAETTIIDTTNNEEENTEEIAQYLKLIAQPSSFHDDVLFYIAGFICRKVMSSLKCTTCLSAVATRASQCDLRDNTAARLTLRKDRGGLMAWL